MIIGDDDGVTSLALKAAEWANRNNICAIRPSLSFIYFWPNSKVFYHDNGNLNILGYSGNIINYDPKDGLIKLLKNSCQNYLNCDLVKLYHGIVKKDLLDVVKSKIGRYVRGLSPDIYLSVALSMVNTGKVAEIDLPVTISGICKESGSSQSVTGEHTGKLEDAPHFRGHSDYKWDIRIPQFYSVETIWADSALAAVNDINPTYNRYYKSETLTYRCLKKYPQFKDITLLTYRENGGNNIKLALYYFSRIANRITFLARPRKIKLTQNAINCINMASKKCELWISEYKNLIQGIL